MRSFKITLVLLFLIASLVEPLNGQVRIRSKNLNIQLYGYYYAWANNEPDLVWDILDPAIRQKNDSAKYTANVSNFFKKNRLLRFGVEHQMYQNRQVVVHMRVLLKASDGERETTHITTWRNRGGRWYLNSLAFENEK